jgi:hypothetical protein
VDRFVRIGPALTVIRLWGKTAGCRDKRCADPADILVGIAVFETPLLVKSLMSQTQGERIGNDQPNAPGDAETTAATFPANTSRPVGSLSLGRLAQSRAFFRSAV